MTHKFEVGDLAIIVRTSCELTFYMNMRCLIMGPLEMRGGSMSHRIEPIQMRCDHSNIAGVWCPPASLKPVKDPGDELASWDTIHRLTGWDPRDHITLRELEYTLREQEFIEWTKLADPERWGGIDND